MMMAVTWWCWIVVHCLIHFALPLSALSTLWHPPRPLWAFVDSAACSAIFDVGYRLFIVWVCLSTPKWLAACSVLCKASLCCHRSKQTRVYHLIVSRQCCHSDTKMCHVRGGKRQCLFPFWGVHIDRPLSLSKMMFSLSTHNDNRLSYQIYQSLSAFNTAQQMFHTCNRDILTSWTRQVLLELGLQVHSFLFWANTSHRCCRMSVMLDPYQ